MSATKSPACPGPDPAPRGPTRFRVPRGAVDTHAHVIGLPPAYPFIERRAYTPPAATPDAYLAMLDATGMTHGVLVQVSVHATDNRLMLDTLRSTSGRLRGIAVVQPDLQRGEAEAMRRAGVAGLRLNVLHSGGLGFDALEATEALCLDMGWHLQFLLDARALPGALAMRLSRLRVPVVMDHMGHFPADVAEPGFQTLLSLVRDGAWVKLSGANRLAPEPWQATPPARPRAARGRTGSLRLGFRLAARVSLGPDDECGRTAGPAGRLGAGPGGARSRPGQ